MSKIYMSLTGGLGNQLYIAATGIAISKIFNQEIVFDTSTYKKYKLHKLLINHLINSLNFENNNLIFRGYPLLSKDRKFLINLKEKKPSYDPSLFQRIKKKLPYCDYLISGYFQSLSYFSHIIPELRNEIINNLLQNNMELNNSKTNNILKNTLTIHIRRKDKMLTINKSIYGAINKEGFNKIISSVINKNDYKFLLIVGDDPKFNNYFKNQIKIKINVITSDFLSKRISAFNDFFYMINSKGLILNNSSFSLWAGYLSNSNNIFYPDLLFPLPKHYSIKYFSIEDLIMPHWESYPNQYR